MDDTSIKVHACCRFGAPLADCALDLYQQGVRAKDVEKIVAKVGDFTIRVLATPREPEVQPVTQVDAKFSLAYTVAVAIVKNRTGIEKFKEEVLGDPENPATIEEIVEALCGDGRPDRGEYDPTADSEMSSGNAR